MGNETARANDMLGAAVRSPLDETARGTTRWRVERWSAEQTQQAIQAMGLRIPASPEAAAEFDRFGVTVDAKVFHKFGIEPYETSELVGNLITNAGWTRLMNLLTAQGGTQALTATAARIGVGNGVTAETYADTDLAAAAGASNRYFQPVTGAGTLGTRTLAFSATFGTADGNFAWNEFGIDVGTPTVTGGTTVAALLFNRKAGIAQGTKAAGQTWTATATITFT